MTEPTQLASDVQAENEIICEKLLGWKRRECFSPYDGRFMGFDFLDGERPTTAPSFTTWAEAGLILEEMAARGYLPKVGVAIPGKWYGINPLGEASYAATGPLAIRAAALEYIRSLS